MENFTLNDERKKGKSLLYTFVVYTFTVRNLRIEYLILSKRKQAECLRLKFIFQGMILSFLKVKLILST
ncbi:hypothetical protein DW075_23985 [Bacteroides xylanisolvens]|uniref:Uncharacterized protein n=1 Tax=Bacteroides xylanisolvens TaxID=371601 RepID=A0A415FDB1_9BACE|nr:hypothetical protein DW075_23985 [Bacteroides xylanisolvens]